MRGIHAIILDTGDVYAVGTKADMEEQYDYIQKADYHTETGFDLVCNLVKLPYMNNDRKAILNDREAAIEYLKTQS